MKPNLILVGMSAIASLLIFGCVESELTCADLRTEFPDLPQELKFQGCEPSQESQLRALRSTYQINGKDSLTVENFLIANYGMAPLRFVCCGWESISDAQGRRYGTYKDQRGYYYDLRMYSGEVLIPEQLQREDVPYFYVDIVVFLEEP